MREIWKPIPGFKDYLVSNLSNIKSLKGKKEKLLTKFINHGYYKVNLMSDNCKVTLLKVMQWVLGLIVKVV